MRTLQKLFIEHMLYPAMEKLKGNQIRMKLHYFQLNEYRSMESIESIQMKKLSDLLRHCIKHVPAYQSLKLQEEEILKSPIHFLHENIPVLRKSTFQANSEAYLSDNIDKADLILNRTGGSTGEPVQFYMTREQVETYEAARWRGLSWYHITPGSRSIMIWGNPVELTQSAQRKYQFRERLLKNRIIISAYQLSYSTIREKVMQIEQYKPEYIYGYSSALTSFAKMMLKADIKIRLKLKVVVSTAETLTDAQKAILEKAFQCPVANEYGARDAGILAYSCPDGHLHISAENSIIEVLDPITLQPLPAGHTGTLAITDLNNFAQPRLRYLLGDVGALSPTPCKCGHVLPVLANLEGREDAMLLGENGQIVHGNVIGQIIRRYDGVRQFRFVQHSPTSATLFLALSEPDTAPTMQIVSEIQKLLPSTKIDVQFVDSIPPTASGKMRYAIREFPLRHI